MARAKLDDNEALQNFAETLEAAVIETVEAGRYNIGYEVNKSRKFRL